MTYRTRFLLLAMLLVAAVVGQVALQRHLSAAADRSAASLTRPLAELPLQIGPWRGEDQPIDDPRWLYADEHLRRVYRLGGNGPCVEVWMAYSGHGSDRSHHPEVCMSVAGQPENAAGRREIPAPGHAEPIQQFRFGSPGSDQLVYYWHYTLPSSPNEGLDELQRWYQRHSCRPGSLTIEVFAPLRWGDDAAYACDFVLALDAAAADILPAGSTRGSERKAVTVID